MRSGADLKGFATFHGGLKTPEGQDYAKSRGPILIMHGAADRLSDPEGSKTLYELVNSKDKTLRLYEGFYHEIYNEPRRAQVFADMEAWLAAHI